MGTRYSVHIFGMVLVALRSAVDRKSTLGKISEVIWLDFFYAIHFVVCFSGLIVSANVHLLWRKGKQMLADQLDRAFVNLMPLFIYPIIFGALLLDATVLQSTSSGTSSSNTARILGIAVLIIISITAFFLACMLRAHIAVVASRQSLAMKLVKAEDSEFAEGRAEVSPLLSSAFNAFDSDRSKAINYQEAKALLVLMYPKKPQKFYKEALKSVSFEDRTINFDGFDDAIRAWRELAQSGTFEDVKSFELDVESRALTFVVSATSQVKAATSKVASVNRYMYSPTSKKPASPSSQSYTTSVMETRSRDADLVTAAPAASRSPAKADHEDDDLEDARTLGI